MKTFFVQIKCELGRAYEVAAELADVFENAQQIFSTSGRWDLLAQFRLEDAEDIGMFVNEHLHRVAGIRDTHTIMVYDAFTPGPA